MKSFQIVNKFNQDIPAVVRIAYGDYEISISTIASPNEIIIFDKNNRMIPGFQKAPDTTNIKEAMDFIDKIG